MRRAVALVGSMLVVAAAAGFGAISASRAAVGTNAGEDGASRAHGPRRPVAADTQFAQQRSRRARRPAKPANKSRSDRPKPEQAVQLDPIDAARYEAGRNVCRALLAGKPIDAASGQPAELPPCVIAAPVRVTGIGTDRIELTPAVLVDCRLAVAMLAWVDQVVQPAAREILGAPVKAIGSASGFVCRPRNNENGSPLSEHAFGKAIDIASFTLADGRQISVANDWAKPREEIVKPAPEPAKTKGSGAKTMQRAAGADRTEPGKAVAAQNGAKGQSGVEAAPAKVGAESKPAQFLKRLHEGACVLFSTVLGPEANALHRDHFHLDLSGRRSGRICE